MTGREVAAKVRLVAFVLLALAGSLGWVVGRWAGLGVAVLGISGGVFYALAEVDLRRDNR